MAYRSSWLRRSVILFTLFSAAPAFAVPGRTTATGVVNDPSGRPLVNATVVIYSAGVRTGYSVFCPTCYVDCGKRTATDSDGRFSIGGLDDELVFNLLIVKSGYSPQWVRTVDPLKGEVPAATVAVRASVDDPTRVVRGKVLDSGGAAVPYALVEEDGATFLRDGQLMTAFGSMSGGDKFSVTDESGEFEIANAVSAKTLILRVSGRATAAALFVATPGAERKTFAVGSGVTVRGRLLKNGKPVQSTELGIVTLRRESGATFPEQRVATDGKGRFEFTNVPVNRVWDLYPKMESLAGRGAMAPIQFATDHDDEVVDVGDIKLEPGITLSGRVELDDGRPVPSGTRVLVQSGEGWDAQNVIVGEGGTFTARGLFPGGYLITPSVKGYRPSPGFADEVLVKRDVSNYVLRLVPFVGAE
ncbi:MAG: carboxypeptidase-like regulatory domain-containing protein [Gammaproteobacteria bacterium]